MSHAEKQRILIVDDDKHLLTTLSDYLAFEGFDVAQAETGETALEQIEGFQPSLVIVDISMPGMGGIGFLRRLELGDGRPQYPVLVLTARSKMEEFFGTLAVDGFLAKPCSEEVLLDRIREILAKKELEARKRACAVRRLLLAEDDVIVLTRLENHFSEAGYHIQTARRGPEVLERATLDRPDAVIIKQRLRGMRGSDVAMLLKTMSSTARIPVLLYDATRILEEDRKNSYQTLEGVEKFVCSNDAGVLLRATKGLFEADPEPFAQPTGRENGR